jgi:hypothetical protein
MCVQASGTSRWKQIRDDLMPEPAFKDAFARKIERIQRQGRIAIDRFEDFLVFQAVRMLVQEYFVPHGICAGSEHQGGQHETGTAPVQAAVNFVTTMTVDGKNIDLVNYWFNTSAVAGDELLFTLEKIQKNSNSYEYNLTRYYKDPQVAHVQPPQGAYWQLVPSILRGDPRAKEETRCSHYNAWRHHLSHGYWRVAQTFQTRRQNNINAFHRGQPLEVTFAPVWQSFRDCRHADGAHNETYIQSHVTSYQSTKALRSVVGMGQMDWYYEGHHVLMIFTARDPDKYWMWANPLYCQIKIEDSVLPASAWGTSNTIPIAKKHFKCVHVTFDDAPATVRSISQPHLNLSAVTPQYIVSRNANTPILHTRDPDEERKDPFFLHELTQTPSVIAPPTGGRAGGSYTGEFLLTLTQRSITPVGSEYSTDFVHSYCSRMEQHYLNFGGNYWALSENEYILASPEFDVHYNGINPYPVALPISGGGGGAPHSTGGSSLLPPHAAGLAGGGGIVSGVVSELPQMHVLAPGTHASLSAVEEAAPLPAAASAAAPDAELPKKKRMKALKFFDGVADTGA